ncbi:MAG TPA: penicillin-binding protein 2 [Rhizomicrobium sp.]|jgi:cell division protein FtsI (penicillin-binding protein 3)
MSEAPTVFQRRIIIGAVLCVAAFALVGVRLVHVTLLKSLDAVHVPVAVAARADLTDRNGELLARDLPVKDLYARPQVFWDKGEAAHDLAQATSTDERRLLSGFNNAKHPYVLIARQITPDTEAKVMHLGLPGLEFEPGAKRYYPDGRNAAHVVGVTDPDNNGVSGLELGLQNQIHAAAGGAVATSIDMRVQYILAHEVETARKTFTARAAGGIVMDVNTGEVLGMVSAPGFDPNARHMDAGDSSRNIMAQDVYELGSVFKIFSFTMAMEDHTLKSLDEVFAIGQGFKIGNHTIHEAEHMPAVLAARDILAQSSNIGTSQIVLRSGGTREREFLTHLGLFKPVATELPETARPLYPSVWGDIQTANVGFGQGIAVAPLSFVAAAATVVNGGRRITPTFLKQEGRDLRGEQVIKPETSIAMRDLLRYVVTNGSGKRADVVGYDVGGKTGSAQVAGPHGRYIPHALRTSFCGVFPVHNPRYVVFILLDQPHGTKETGGFALAGWTAAPAVARVIQRIAPLLGVPNTAPPTKLAGGPT